MVSKDDKERGVERKVPWGGHFDREVDLSSRSYTADKDGLRSTKEVSTNKGQGSLLGPGSSSLIAHAPDLEELLAWCHHTA
jgi:hypothetical protein